MKSKKTTNMLRLIVIALAFTLSGCVVGPDYFRPKLDVPAAFLYGEKGAQETATPSGGKNFMTRCLMG